MPVKLLQIETRCLQRIVGEDFSTHLIPPVAVQQVGSRLLKLKPRQDILHIILYMAHGHGLEAGQQRIGSDFNENFGKIECQHKCNLQRSPYLGFSC